MNAAPDSKLVEEIAIELGVDASFVEKDWYAMRLVALISSIDHPSLRLVFSGGTSLSKGYGLIRRFSEDLDFKLMFSGEAPSRGTRKKYRGAIVEAIRGGGDWQLGPENVSSHMEDRFFRCLVTYPASFAPASALRRQIKLEVSFLEPARKPEERPLHSFFAEARGHAPEVASIACVSPVETAADKLSALTWRVLTRNRDSARDDPTMIRHLHDLVALEAYVLDDQSFPELLHHLVVTDASRGAMSAELQALEPDERIGRALEVLATDARYPGEYTRFVLAMSYADDDQRPSFDVALKAARRIAGLITSRADAVRSS